MGCDKVSGRVIAIAAYVVLLLMPGTSWAQAMPSSPGGAMASVEVSGLGGAFGDAASMLGSGSEELRAADQLLDLVGRGGAFDIGMLPEESLAGLEAMEQGLLLLGAPTAYPDAIDQQHGRPGLLDQRLRRVQLASRQAEGCGEGQTGCASMRSCLEGTPCDLSEFGLPLELAIVFFDFSGSRLRPESYLVLDRVVALLNRYPPVVVEVSGHTDGIGSDESNRRLSEQRARAVHDYLLEQGIEPDRLRYRGYSSQRPVSPNLAQGRDFPEGPARHRRVELKAVADFRQAHK
jgi:outer membrane protein OmpA-like peptidoglycan-associated protein